MSTATISFADCRESDAQRCEERTVRLNAKAADAISEQMDFLNFMRESVTKSMNLNVALK